MQPAQGPNPRPSPTPLVYLPPFLVIAVVLYRLYASNGYVAVEDDAFYYLLVARNLVETGASAAMPRGADQRIPPAVVSGWSPYGAG